MNLNLIIELSSIFLKDKECLNLLLISKYIRNNIKMNPSFK